MRARSIFGPLILLTLTGPAPADDWAARLFSERGVDFGAVPRGAIRRHEFLLTNTTNDVVNILDVRASCGCTTGRALATTIPPGQSTVIEAEMDTRNFVGVKATKLTISLVTAGGRQAEVALTVRSNILSDIVLNPGSLQFGTLARGQTAEQVLTIDRHGAPSWRIERMVATKNVGRYVEATLSEAYRGAQGVGYVLSVRLKPDAPTGALSEEIRLVTNDQETPVVPVLVRLEVRGALSATPTSLVLGQASSAAGPVQGRILVRGAKPFTIRAIEGTGDGFEVVENDPGEKALHILAVTFRPERSTSRGDVRRSFRILTSQAKEPPLDVQASVQVAP